MLSAISRRSLTLLGWLTLNSTAFSSSDSEFIHLRNLPSAPVRYAGFCSPSNVSAFHSTLRLNSLNCGESSPAIIGFMETTPGDVVGASISGNGGAIATAAPVTFKKSRRVVAPFGALPTSCPPGVSGCCGVPQEESTSSNPERGPRNASLRLFFHGRLRVRNVVGHGESQTIRSSVQHKTTVVH